MGKNKKQPTSVGGSTAPLTFNTGQCVEANSRGPFLSSTPKTSQLVEACHRRVAAWQFDQVATAGRRRPCHVCHGRARHERQVARKHRKARRTYDTRTRPNIAIRPPTRRSETRSLGVDECVSTCRRWQHQHGRPRDENAHHRELDHGLSSHVCLSSIRVPRVSGDLSPQVTSSGLNLPPRPIGSPAPCLGPASSPPAWRTDKKLCAYPSRRIDSDAAFQMAIAPNPEGARTPLRCNPRCPSLSRQRRGENRDSDDYPGHVKHRP